MAHDYPGPKSNIAKPSGDDAIYAYQHCSGPHGTGSLNYVNNASGNGNNDAINAAFGNNTDPNRAQTSPGYVPQQQLVDACAGFTAWWDANHSKDGDKKHKGNDPSKKHD
jgi:hypothetical protein